MKALELTTVQRSPKRAEFKARVLVRDANNALRACAFNARVSELGEGCLVATVHATTDRLTAIESALGIDKGQAQGMLENYLKGLYSSRATKALFALS